MNSTVIATFMSLSASSSNNATATPKAMKRSRSDTNPENERERSPSINVNSDIDLSVRQNYLGNLEDLQEIDSLARAKKVSDKAAYLLSSIIRRCLRQKWHTDIHIDYNDMGNATILLQKKELAEVFYGAVDGVASWKDFLTHGQS
jgi:hypothetical protein